VDRDFTPEIPKRLSVSAYPSMLVMGAQEENIFRWSGYAETGPFMQQMNKALARFDLYRAGQTWDTPEPRPATICNTGTSQVLQAPADDRLSGLCYAGGVLWCLHKDKLYELDPSTGNTMRSLGIGGKDLYVDLAGDADFLILLPYGWTAGQGILKYNLKKGIWETPIETQANKSSKVYGARGIAIRDGVLFVSSHLGIQKVNAQTGEASPPVKPDLTGYRLFGLSGLDFDGPDLVGAGAIEKIKLDAEGKPVDNWYGLDKERPRLSAILRIDPETGAVRKYEVLNYPVNTLASWNGTFWMAEQPEMGYDRKNQPVRLYPKKMAIYRLVLNR